MVRPLTDAGHRFEFEQLRPGPRDSSPGEFTFCCISPAFPILLFNRSLPRISSLLWNIRLITGSTVADLATFPQGPTAAFARLLGIPPAVVADVLANMPPAELQDMIEVAQLNIMIETIIEILTPMLDAAQLAKVDRTPLPWQLPDVARRRTDMVCINSWLRPGRKSNA